MCNKANYQVNNIDKHWLHQLQIFALISASALVNLIFAMNTRKLAVELSSPSNDGFRRKTPCLPRSSRRHDYEETATTITMQTDHNCNNNHR